MEMREAAERILMAETLEEKLCLPPLLASDEAPGRAIVTPDAPGRPAELKNVESMVGLLINALPIATQVPAEQPVAQWLASLQELQLNARQHEYASLIEVQGWSDVPRGNPLFNTLLVFENYPKTSSDRALEPGALAITGRQPIEWTNYPLTLVANVGNQLYIRFDYDQTY